MANRNSTFSEWSDAALLRQLRESWIVLSEVQIALEEDATREQDRRSRFSATVGMVLERQDGLLEELETRGRGLERAA